jgi:hypothetical protein
VSSKDYIVTAYLAVEVRIERVTDEDMAIGVAHDYLTQIDPLTGQDTLMKRLAEAVEPTVWFPTTAWDWPEMEAEVAEDSEVYEDDPEDEEVPS